MSITSASKQVWNEIEFMSDEGLRPECDHPQKSDINLRTYGSHIISGIVCGMAIQRKFPGISLIGSVVFPIFFLPMVATIKKIFVHGNKKGNVSFHENLKNLTHRKSKHLVSLALGYASTLAIAHSFSKINSNDPVLKVWAPLPGLFLSSIIQIIIALRSQKRTKPEIN